MNGGIRLPTENDRLKPRLLGGKFRPECRAYVSYPRHRPAPAQRMNHRSVQDQIEVFIRNWNQRKRVDCFVELGK